MKTNNNNVTGGEPGHGGFDVSKGQEVFFPKHTRKEYLAHLCTHDEYYGQFLDWNIVEHVAHSIGIRAILDSNDPDHFNDIPLSRWDGLHFHNWSEIVKKLKRAGDVNADTLGNKVCVAKRAARFIRNGGKL